MKYYLCHIVYVLIGAGFTPTRLNYTTCISVRINRTTFCNSKVWSEFEQYNLNLPMFYSPLRGHMQPSVEKGTPWLLHVQQASVHMVRCSTGLSKERGLPGVHVEQSRSGKEYSFNTLQSNIHSVSIKRMKLDKLFKRRM